MGMKLDAISYFFAETGYRWDQAGSRVAILDASAKQRLNGISSWQLGGRGWWQVCNPWFLKGHAHYGWIFGGNYREESFEGRLDGNTIDLSGGGGYLFCWNDFQVGPSIGWSFDELNTVAKRVTFLREERRAIAPNINSRQHVDGPWVGLDFLFYPRKCYQLVLNYELHRGFWKGQRAFHGRDIGSDLTGFSNRRKANLWGNALTLEAHRFGYCYSFGLFLKYQIYNHASRGRFERISTPLLSRRSVRDVVWQSFSAGIQLGYHF